MTRFARTRRVFYVEEPVRDASPGAAPRLDVQRDRASGVHVVVPRVPFVDDEPAVLTSLFRDLYDTHDVRAPISWYDSPLSITTTRTLPASVVVYDCTIELSPAVSPLGSRLESELFSRAHIVFTSVRSMYEHTRARHANVHLAPSSVDVAHFARARVRAADLVGEPADQAHIARPRVGFIGVVDHRVDLDMLHTVAALRRNWQFVLIGPVVHKPVLHNVHTLGYKPYEELPRYIAGWDVAFLPFARDEKTRFMTPTKAAELMAAGLSVVATPLTDIVEPYGQAGLVAIASTAQESVAAIERALAERDGPRARGRDHAAGSSVVRAHDLFLATMSWDSTFEGIVAAIADLGPTTRVA